MVKSDKVASEITEAVKEVLGPAASEDALARALAERVLQRLEAGGMSVVNAQSNAPVRWMPHYRS